MDLPTYLATYGLPCSPINLLAYPPSLVHLALLLTHLPTYLHWFIHNWVITWFQWIPLVGAGSHYPIVEGRMGDKYRRTHYIYLGFLVLYGSPHQLWPPSLANPFSCKRYTSFLQLFKHFDTTWWWWWWWWWRVQKSYQLHSFVLFYVYVVNLSHIISCEDGMIRYASVPVGRHPLLKKKKKKKIIIMGDNRYILERLMSEVGR